MPQFCAPHWKKGSCLMKNLLATALKILNLDTGLKMKVFVFDMNPRLSLITGQELRFLEIFADSRKLDGPQSCSSLSIPRSPAASIPLMMFLACLCTVNSND